MGKPAKKIRKPIASGAATPAQQRAMHRKQHKRHEPDWIEVRARMRRAFEERKPVPAGLMVDGVKGGGLYEGHGQLMGPVDAEGNPVAFEVWVEWVRGCVREPRRAARSKRA